MKSCGSSCKKIWQVKCQTKGCGEKTDIMITKEEYLSALELVDKYHRQFEKIDIVSNNKTLVADWVIKYDERISGRLIKCLEAKDYLNKDKMYFKYMEDINRRSFFEPRGNGSTSWLELQRVLVEIEKG
jgi:hypothetical protein